MRAKAENGRGYRGEAGAACRVKEERPLQLAAILQSYAQNGKKEALGRMERKVATQRDSQFGLRIRVQLVYSLCKRLCCRST
jgi:hypothetical protein